tara:strand:- start:1803 stop:2078 length:276 start_codon:yes stop_codon:yes gene_type:complete
MSIINLSINLEKIDKTKIIEGKKGKYLNVTIARNKDGEDQFGNTHYAFISQSKEERTGGQDKTYLGNGKEFVFDNAPQTATTTTEDTGLPF